jgi:hypothetical protein
MDPISNDFISSDRSNWQDWGARWSRRNGFMRHLRTVLEELDITYTQPIQPIIMPSLPGSFLPPNIGSAAPTRTPTVRLQHPRPRRAATGAPTQEDLGNAGSFQGAGSEFLRAPGGTISSEPSSF